ncbi:MAG: hydantoinase/oxoprolinase family protein [Rhizobiaceae bacterium]|nr:hydantoinase/oxoprolinase family protein [Rhizobiaceae bacterium]
MSRQNKILLGIDTGGTYTDAVLFSRAKGVLAKAKSLTTKHDLAIGISGAVDAVLDQFTSAASEIALVSISTTLATNALVEGKGGSIGLVMIGFEETDMEKSGLREALGGDPVVFLPGGHDVQGNERPLDISPLEAFLADHAEKVSGFAIAGYFAVRNASHELKVKDYLTEKTGLASTCSHELSSKLGGPKRALTTVLNARLIPVIQDLIHATQQHLLACSIHAPLMVVRGDGALVSAEFALNRPIETILSGPAASLIGAKSLLGATDAIVSDIGGTTTDVAILDKGWPRVEPNGASVGGFTTMVEAVAMHTFGLGGDSTVQLDDQQGLGLKLGPRRQVPISLLAQEFPDLVVKELDRQLGMETVSPLSASFAWKSVADNSSLPNLKATEQKLFVRMTAEPQALDTLLKGSSEAGTLNRLVSRGLVQVAGVTPSDAMHVLGLQDNWNAEAAAKAVQIFQKQKDRFGNFVASSSEHLCGLIKDQLTRQSADVIIETCMKENDVTIGPGAAALIDRALEGKPGFVKFNLTLDRPLVGLGASAHNYYPAIGGRLSSKCHVPEHADVANALGAVAGEVRIQRSLTVTSSDGGSSFQILLESGPEVHIDEEKALMAAESHLLELVSKLVSDAGAENPVYETNTDIHAAEIEGSRHFVQADITVSATGLPKLENA